MAAPIRVEYFTDPYCAWSWAFEPTWQALLHTEEDGIAVTYRSHALVPDLEKSGKRGSDIADAWERVARLTGSHVDASLWRSGALHSTIPGLHASKAAGSLGRGKEGKFLQALRPLVMRGGQSADNPDTLMQAARDAGLDERAFDEALHRDFGDQLAEDARRSVEVGVTSTPAVLMTNAAGDKVLITGLRDLELFKRAIESLRLEEDLEQMTPEAPSQPRVTTTPLMQEAPEAAEQKHNTW